MTSSALFLREPKRRWFWLGVIAASFLPVIVGFICFAAFLSETDDIFKMFALLPLTLVFALAVPITAFLSARQIKRSQPVSFGSVFKIGLARATSAQFIIFCAHTMAFIAFLVINGLGQDGGRIWAILPLVGMAFTAHVVLWFLITLPLTLVSMGISRMVSLTRKPLTYQPPIHKPFNSQPMTTLAGH